MAKKSSNYASLDDLVGGGLPEEDVVLPSGAKIRIRALNRQQVHKVGGYKATGESEKHTIAAALVTPDLGPRAVEQWMNSAPASEFTDLVAAVMKLSGIGEEFSDKATFPDDGSGSSDRVQDVSGSGVGDDSASA